MNPSYGNGMPSASGGRPGVISSGPDSASTPPVSMPNVSGRAGSGFGRTSGSGGPKKGIIIGGILMILALGLGTAAVVVMMNSRNGSGNSENNIAAFNKLINYVTDGVELTSEIDTKYGASEDYYFLYGWDDEEEKREVYAKTEDLMNNFVSSYKNGDNEVLNNLVKNTKEQLDFIYVMDFSEKVLQLQAMKTVIENGDARGKQVLLNQYDFSGLSDNPYVKKFTEVYAEWVDILVFEVGLYRERGCVTGNYVDSSCAENATNDMEVVANGLFQDVRSYYNMSKQFVGNVYNINELIHGRVIMELNDE